MRCRLEQKVGGRGRVFSSLQREKEREEMASSHFLMLNGLEIIIFLYRKLHLQDWVLPRNKSTKGQV